MKSVIPKLSPINQAFGFLKVSNTRLAIDRALGQKIFSNSPKDVSHSALIGHRKKDRCDLVAQMVKEDGFMVLHDVFDNNMLSSLRTEFDSIILSADNLSSNVDRHDGATCVRISPMQCLSSIVYPTILAFFHSRIFQSIASNFFSGNPGDFSFNSEIFVHETPETPSPLSGTLHWDKRPTLKFWIYVDHVPWQSGPMVVERGSAFRNTMTRERKIRNCAGDFSLIDNSVTPDTTSLVNLTGNAGSVVIHNTDASHGATPVQPGFVRRIIRGHCRAS